MKRVRLAKLAIVAVMLLAVGPAVADKTPYSDTIPVQDDAYVKPGWWWSGDETGGVAVNNSSTENRQEIHWLWIKDSDDDADSPAVVNVDARGSVIAAMDVFKIREPGSITPACPQYLVEDLYREEGENVIFWADRLVRETAGYHQRSVGVAEGSGGNMSVELHPEDSPNGWFVAIYPQAGSAHSEVTAATGEPDPRIEYNISVANGDMTVDATQTHEQPDAPFHLEEWGLILTNPGILVDCAENGVALPPSVTDLDPTELPGPGPVQERIGSLLDTNLS